MNRHSAFSRCVVGSIPGLLALGLVSSPAYAQKITFGGGGAAQPSGNAATGSAGAAAPKPAATKAPPPAATPKTGTTEKVEETPETSEWSDRDSAADEAASLPGGLGLLHVEHAQPGKSGQFRLAFTPEFFSASFQCTSVYPCPNPNGGDALTSGTSTNHIGGTIAVGVSILDWLEAYASTGAYANSNDANRPSLLQVLGDTTFGVKGAYDFKTKWLWVGFAPELHLVNGTGSVGLSGSGTGARFPLLATMDMRQMKKRIPLRVSLNLAYNVDNSGEVVTDTEAARGTPDSPQPITRIERFGLKINRVDHFDIGLGAETFLVHDRIRPFVEFSMLAPINRQGYACHTNNPSSDNCLASDTVIPTTLTLGGRFYPWKRGFSLLAAVDIGMTGVANFIEEIAPNAPYTVYLGAGWAIDTWERPPVEKTKMVEKVVAATPPPEAKIKGFVHEKDKTDVAVPNAIVAWDNHPELTSLVAGADGHFITQSLPVGKYTFAVKGDGYKDGSCAAAVQAAGKDVTIDCPLEALPRVGTLVGHVRDAESNAPVPNATVKLKDASGKELQVTADSGGGYKFEGVAPGNGSLSVEADDYLSFVEPADVKVRQEVTTDAIIRKRPKKSLVRVTKKEIQIKQQIQFALDQAVILPESVPLLTEIADVLIHNPEIKRVEIQGHTDNSGTPAHNQTLSEQRADSVKTWLQQHGVNTELEAKGYGQTRPLVPNVTAANKAKNRRVQFIILEREGAAPAAGGAKHRQPPPF